MLLASGAALALTPVVGDTADDTDADATVAAEDSDAALDRALKRLVTMDGHPPGVVAIVQRGDHEEVHAFGVANLAPQRPMSAESADDRMRIASTAKAFSGAVALSLVRKGPLSLDDTIGQRLSDLPDPPPDTWSEVTLRQLLNHTSGLPDYTDQENDAFIAALLASPTQAPPPEDLLPFAWPEELNEGELLFKPGKKYHYSNTAT